MLNNAKGLVPFFTGAAAKLRHACAANTRQGTKELPAQASCEKVPGRVGSGDA